MPLDQLLVEILVDPEDKLPLWYVAAENLLYNPRLHRSYAVRDGIPVLLIDEAVTVSEAEAKRFAALAPEEFVETGRSGLQS